MQALLQCPLVFRHYIQRSFLMGYCIRVDQFFIWEDHKKTSGSALFCASESDRVDLSNRFQLNVLNERGWRFQICEYRNNFSGIRSLHFIASPPYCMITKPSISLNYSLAFSQILNATEQFMERPSEGQTPGPG